jgi:hypothetical protein
MDSDLWLDPGTRVIVDGYGEGNILVVDPGWSEYEPIVQEYDNPGYSRMPGYIVHLDSDKQVTAERRAVRLSSEHPAPRNPS